MKRLCTHFVFTLLILIYPANCWFLPGSAPKAYKRGEKVEVKVNAINSVFTQMPFDFYSIKFPKPEKIQHDSTNLGEILLGERSENSLFEFKMATTEECKVLGDQPIELTQSQMYHISNLVSLDYSFHMTCEGMPLSTIIYELDSNSSILSSEPVLGSPVGFVNNNDKFFYNHITFYIHYNQPDENEEYYYIVGFEAQQNSFDNYNSGLLTNCEGEKLLLKNYNETKKTYFTYSVNWLNSNVTWASRMDVYKNLDDTHIHWFSIANALFIVSFLGGLVAVVLYRTLLKDIDRYNLLSLTEDIQEDWGWKLLHGDVFRRPKFFALLSASTGTGIQILGIFLIGSLSSILGIISPQNRGAIIQGMMVCFGFMGFPAGYVTAKFYKTFDNNAHTSMRAPLYTALLFPGVCFTVFMTLNTLLWIKRSTAAVPSRYLLFILFLWLGFSVPFVFFGYKFGAKQPAFDIPVRVNKIPREIPKHHWLTNPLLSCIIGGILPFGALFTELIFLMSSIWYHKYYYLFSFLFLVLIILIISCGEISITLTYFRLTNEDYKWWWKSFFFSAFSGLYIFLFSIIYYFTRIQINGFVPTCLYFGYMFIISYAFFLLTGACGFIATFFFLKAIYASIKVE